MTIRKSKRGGARPGAGRPQSTGARGGTTIAISKEAAERFGWLAERITKDYGRPTTRAEVVDALAFANWQTWIDPSKTGPRKYIRIETGSAALLEIKR